MVGVEWYLIHAKSREIVADVIVAVAILSAQIAGQRRNNAKGRKWKQPAIRDLIQAMTVCVVAAQRQPPPMLGYTGLQAGVVAARICAEFIDIAKAWIKRPFIRERRKAAIAHGLIAIQLHLVWLMHCACPNIIDTQRTA